MVLNKIDTLLQIRVFVLLLLIRYVNDNKNVTVNQIDQIKKSKNILADTHIGFCKCFHIRSRANLINLRH